MLQNPSSSSHYVFQVPFLVHHPLIRALSLPPLQAQQLEFRQGEGEEGLTCPLCDTIFARRYSYMRHMEDSHSGRRPFKCLMAGCDYATNRKESMKSHCLRKHEMSGDEFDFKAKEEWGHLVKPKGRRKKKGDKDGDKIVVE